MRLHKTLLTATTLALVLGAQANADDSTTWASAQTNRDTAALTTPGAYCDQTELGSVLFTSDSVEIDQRLSPFLVSTAALVARDESLIIGLQGYADVRGSRNHNYTLHYQRVRSMAAFPIRHGVEPAQIASAGFGEVRAQANVNDHQGQIFDHRVSISLGRSDTRA